MTTIVSVENITKSYGDFRAVDFVSFEVFSGEIFAMLGPNGAGKSTTIRMMLDILRPDQGTIQILGQKISDKLKDRIGYLPEERGLYKDVKVLDMMVYMGRLKGLSAKAARKNSLDLLERLELADQANQKVKEFSKGMQQKVQFAVTILHQPDLIIVDEPFSGLDPINTQLIKDMLFELKAQGMGIIMSTHQMYQVEEMADRLMMINRGKRVLYGEVDHVRKNYARHAIIVEGQGNWAQLNGVINVEADANSRNGQVLQLADGIHPDTVLAEIAASPDYTIESFARAVPSLNDIFIAVAGERPEDVEAEQVQREAAHV
jgi:ABC-2 type transport system ATP-binding protein